MKTKLVAGVLAASLMLVFVAGVSPAKSPEYPSKISGVYVQGNSNIPSEQIFQNIISKVGDSLSEDKVNDDIKLIYAMGYFSDVKRELKKTASGTEIRYIVKENPVIRGISLEGFSVYPEQKILSTLESRTGAIMSFKSIQNDVQAIEQLYRGDGYILAKVVDVSVDPATEFLTIKLIEGRIENVIINGTKNTKDYVILREMNSKPGSVLNEVTLRKDLRRVFNLGFFSEVTPDFEPGLDNDKVSVVMNIKEGKTNTINFGGGYGEREGWFGFVDLSAENLFGTGQGTLLRGQSGQQQSTYQFRYSVPWFMPQQLGDRTTLTFRRWLTMGKNVYLVDTPEREGVYNGWETAFNRPISDEWSVGLSVGSERVDNTAATTFEPYTSNTVGLSVSYDSRDNWMNPSTGVYYVLGLRRGWKIASAQTNFTKYTLDLNRFLPLGSGQVLAMHLGVGTGIGDVPIGEIFYAGGANTIRGYDPSESRTGKDKLIANIEYRYSFNDMFQGVLFFDWGNAWNTGWPDPGKFISGRGFGLRLNTPMGPIRLDYGIGSNRAFSEGTLHFSVGHAF